MEGLRENDFIPLVMALKMEERGFFWWLVRG